MNTQQHHGKHRLARRSAPSMQAFTGFREIPRGNISVDCGWGRLIFGQTFADNRVLADTVRAEKPQKRDIAIYIRDPHVVVGMAPQDLFLDPSHTFRLWLDRYDVRSEPPRVMQIRRMLSFEDAQTIHELYLKRGMATASPEFLWEKRDSRTLTYVVAEENVNGRVVGAVMGVDHVEAFDDPENGSSLWSLAVDPQAVIPGIGEALVRFLLEHYQARGRAYTDLSVMYDNAQAILLYEKLGFVRVPAFAVKRKNPINEPLFVAEPLEERLNPYAKIIVKEARRRGIAVEVLDEEASYFSLSFGGRNLLCRESLSELTSAVAMSRCDDKRVTRRVLEGAQLAVPDQRRAGEPELDLAFLERHQRIVVKPARGEQGAGITVDVRDPEALELAIAKARSVNEEVLLEELVEGDDLRIVVIDFQVAAAAVRRPPRIVGDGVSSVETLIAKLSRRRAAATGGESQIPLDDETTRCVEAEGHTLESVLAVGASLLVRKTANLHTGGTIHDVTAELHPVLAGAAVKAARALDIPVVGLDLLVPSVTGPNYVIIEANERPGLANHEPQPTAERFVDLLFPQTAAA